jgi:hypothetical protein
LRKKFKIQKNSDPYQNVTIRNTAKIMYDGKENYRDTLRGYTLVQPSSVMTKRGRGSKERTKRDKEP